MKLCRLTLHCLFLAALTFAIDPPQLQEQQPMEASENDDEAMSQMAAFMRQRFNDPQERRPASQDMVSLHQAAYWGDAARISEFLQDGVDVEGPDAKGETALFIAAKSGRTAVVDLLLDRGANVNHQRPGHETALQAAAEGGHHETVEALLSRNADPNLEGGIMGSPLQVAAFRNRSAVVTTLLRNGAKLDTTCGRYGSAVHAVASAGLNPMMEVLLAHSKASINVITGEQEMTPLQRAARDGQYSTVDLLVEKGSDVNAPAGEFGCALQATISSTRNEGLEDLVMCKHAEIKAEKLERQEQQVKLLLSHNADVNALGGEYGTPLGAAAAFGRLHLVRLLLQNGAKPSSQAGRLGTALQAAATKGEMPIEWAISLAEDEEYDQILMLLLDSGAEVNAVGGRYGTALQGAAWAGNLAYVKLLLGRGADPNQRAGKYGCALKAAVDQGHADIVEALKQSGAVDEPVGETQDQWWIWEDEPAAAHLTGYGRPRPKAMRTQKPS